MEGSLADIPSKDFITIPAPEAHTATVIFVHGMGQFNQDWKKVVDKSLAPDLPHVTWIFPQAVKRSVGYHPGEIHPSWFDITTLPPGPNEYDEQTILESISVIEGIISSQVQAGLDARRIVLVAFSQGAALSSMVALTTRHRLGGVVSLSGWIPPRAQQMLHAAPWLSVLWCHGMADDEIPISHGHDALVFLRDSGRIPESQLQLYVYEGLKHTINDAEMKDVASWLKTILQ